MLGTKPVRKPKKILASFPRHLTARDVQKNALLELEKAWDSADIFVINLPVSAGKSAIAMSIARWVGKATIITPNKMLVDQYQQEYPSLQVLRSKSDYFCSTFQVPVDKRPKGKGMPTLCSDWEHCDGCSTYRDALKKSRVMPYLTVNYHIYMSHKLYKPTLVIDEAHQLIPMIKGMAAKKLWQFHHRFPSNLDSRDKIKRWVNSLPPEKFNYKWTKAGDDRKWSEQGGLQALKDELNSIRPSYLVRMTTDNFKDEEHYCIKMEPLDIKGHEAVDFMLPKQVKKIVLMSATISRKDIEQLGISDRKIVYIQASSPISAENRPVYIDYNAAERLNYQNQTGLLPKLAEYIMDLANYHEGQKGLVHLTYGLAEQLRNLIGEDKRFIWHDRDNKRQQYQHFRDSDGQKILIASGLYEGIDLPYDAGRWQVIGKVPWPSLADPAIKHLSDLDPEYYAWEVCKTFQQACGRICRTPTDYGVTYCFDSSIDRLINNYPDFWPKWWTEALNIVGDK